jgi:hypothetical protein
VSQKILCPRCGEEITTEMTLWTLQGKWYCSERCARLAGGMKVQDGHQ